ncbi:OLC1v1016896C1 [Oldenlandia corymbosa var. corymbosa]|uniref:OLC1v1016896C1 n=1 Tax=Oldenlandia corymbosa var. corymbosa TaxID=529605 RepID=A0AAV1E8A8_OLDCO|nr:OLC1v1016896C1 [Oldenlandia corymbosa var. corymbosa]
MKTKGGHQNKFLRIITIPFRALGKARDLYVKSMTSYATKVGYGTNYMGTNSPSYATVLPKSFSANLSRADDNEDLRELIRAASARTVAEKMDINQLMLQHQMMMGQHQNNQNQRPPPPQSRLGGVGVVGPKGMPPRSISVGMARIDEEKPYSVTAAGGVDGKKFGKSSSKKGIGMLYPRSKSYAVNKKNLFSD